MLGTVSEPFLELPEPSLPFVTGLIADSVPCEKKTSLTSTRAPVPIDGERTALQVSATHMGSRTLHSRSGMSRSMTIFECYDLVRTMLIVVLVLSSRRDSSVCRTLRGTMEKALRKLISTSTTLLQVDRTLTRTPPRPLANPSTWYTDTFLHEIPL